MGLILLRLLTFLCIAVALSASLAHLFTLPNKIGMSAEQYLAAQQAYQGWWMLGLFVAAGIVLLLALALIVRRHRTIFALTGGAFLCFLAAHVIFWIFTYPANEATANWTTLPENWAALRAAWEYSHAAGAMLNLVGFMLLTGSVLVRENAEVFSG